MKRPSLASPEMAIYDDNFTLRLPSATRARLQAIAERDKRSLAFVVNQCLDGYLPVLEASQPPRGLHLNEKPKRPGRR